MAANALAYLFETSGLDWSKLGIEFDQWDDRDIASRLKPQDFLQYAQEDLRDGGQRGHVNCLSNCKRAIDCQVDGSIAALGYGTELRKNLGPVVAFLEQEYASDLPLSFKFLQSFGVLAPSLIERVRDVRHALEHRYIPPSKKKATESFELAMLFVRAAERSLLAIPSSFGFGSGIDPKHDDQLEREVFFRFEDGKIEVCSWKRTEKGSERINSTTVSPVHSSYYWILRLAFALRDRKAPVPILRQLLKFSGTKIDAKKVRFISDPFCY